VKKALTETAEKHGVPVRPATDDATTTAQRRAEQLKSLLAKLF
jgi:hypothetical protein